MNRRSFLTGMLKAATGAMILPSAITYARQWKASTGGVWVPNPAWESSKYEMSFVYHPIRGLGYYVYKKGIYLNMAGGTPEGNPVRVVGAEDQV